MNRTLIREVTETEDDRALIENELNRILRCRQFSNAPQMSAFLNYIVNQALDGNANRIKAYTVGVDALGKPPTFDAQGDPSVRVLALRLRKTLSQLYDTSMSPRVQIKMRVGSYVPEFIKTPAPVAGRSVPRSLALAETPTATPTSTVNKSHSTLARPRLKSVELKASDQPERLSTTATRSPVHLLERGGAVLPSSLLFRHGVPLLLLAFSTVIVIVAWLSVFTARPALANWSHSLPSKNSIEIALNWSDRSGQRRYLRSVAALLSASVTVADKQRVIWSEPHYSATERAGSTYELSLSEVVVGSQSVVNTQLISVVSGAVVTSKTLTFDRDLADLSRQEIDQIIDLANEMKSPSGPLLSDFCSSTANVNDIACSG